MLKHVASNAQNTLKTRNQKTLEKRFSHALGHLASVMRHHEPSMGPQTAWWGHPGSTPEAVRRQPGGTYYNNGRLAAWAVDQPKGTQEAPKF